MDTEVMTRTKNPSGTCAGCSLWHERLELDHVTPIFEGGANDTSNLQWLCLPCHKEKTRAEQRRSTTALVRSGRLAGPTTPEGKMRARTANVGRKHTPEALANIRAGVVRREADRAAAKATNERGH